MTAKKRTFVFSITRTVIQSAEIKIKAANEEQAEELFNKKREETNDFEKAEWSTGEAEGPIDWEVDDGEEA